MKGLSSPARLEPQGWMNAPAVQHVMGALAADGAPPRFVGGCVRDAVLGLPIRDIDIATPEKPDAVMRLLEDAGVKVIPTGLKHGTVTAVVDKQVFEVTTLRVDTETDGRWARVAFTDDWRADAARRDFTMNALSCGLDGALFDYFGGVSDLKAGKIRFIGDPNDRLAEDYLRLLRFFRFFAWYGRGEIDPVGLSACRAAAAQIRTLSGERVWQELSRLLLAPDPAPALSLMAAQGVLTHLLPVDDAKKMSAKRVAAIAKVEAAHKVSPDAIRRLAAWLSPAAAGDEKTRQDLVRKVSSRLVHSNQERARLRNILLSRCRPGADLSLAENRKILYRLGDADAFIDLVLFRWAVGNGDAESWGKAADLPLTDPPPAFPLSGDDVLALGLETGPRIGELLAVIEEEWIESDFANDRDGLLLRLESLARESGKSA